VVSEQKTETATDVPSSVVTLTLTGVLVSINSQLTLADAVVTVDFGKIATQRIARAVSSPQKTEWRDRRAGDESQGPLVRS
jgi:type 1 fimbria pilin